MAHSRNPETSSYSDSAVRKHLVLLLTAVASPSTGAILYVIFRASARHPASCCSAATLKSFVPCFGYSFAFLVRSCFAFFRHPRSQRGFLLKQGSATPPKISNFSIFPIRDPLINPFPSRKSASLDSAALLSATLWPHLSSRARH